jgi:hypothetical protein
LSKEFIDHYGALNEGLRLNVKNAVIIYWRIIEIFRWTITVIIIIFLRETPPQQIFVLLIQSMVA